MKKHFRILALLLLTAMLMPTVLACATATGYPAHWHTDVFPQTYWDVMDELIPSPDALPDLMKAWEKEFGEDTYFWPYKYSAAMHALEEIGESPILGIPAEDDLQEDKAVELAWSQFRADAKGIYEDSLMDEMIAVYTFRYQYNGEDYDHLWGFEFTTDGEKTYGDCTIDAKTEEFINHSAEIGYG